MKPEVLALARTTPVTRGAIEELVRKVPPRIANEHALAALDGAGATAAMVLAFAAASGGEKLDPALTRALLPEVLSLDQVGPLVRATAGEARDVLVRCLEDKWGDLELECLVLLLAAEAFAAAPDVKPPPSMLTRARWLARHKLDGEASVLLGGAVLRLKNADLSSLSSPHVNRAKRSKKVIDDVLATSRLPPLEVLPEVDGARLSSGFTVKNETSTGRNDPCPCGSGKKYKKCHALGGDGPASAVPARIDAATVGPDQAALLRPSEIASLETARLSSKSFREAFRRAVDFRHWDLVHRMIDESEAVRGKGEKPDPTLLLRDALLGAFEANAVDAAVRIHARFPENLQGDEAFAIECLRGGPDLLSRIEKEAEEALRQDADGLKAVLLSDALLRWYPALGIYVARGALHEGRTQDSRALLERMEDARDRLLLSPFEAWWDVYEAFFENADDRVEKRKDDEKREKMKAALRAARAASRKTATELEKVQQRVTELDVSLGPASRTKVAATATTTPPPADLVEERKRLKTKVDELQRIIGEGQDERRELRRQLADREEREEDEAPRSLVREPEEDEDQEDDGESVDGPRAILVPRYADRATKAVMDLAADAAEGVLTVVAALAAGKPNAWGGVKQLAKVRGVLSARAGIHHRVLFAVNDRALDVLEVLHRRDLEQVVARLARTT